MYIHFFHIFYKIYIGGILVTDSIEHIHYQPFSRTNRSLSSRTFIEYQFSFIAKWVIEYVTPSKSSRVQ